MGQKANENLSEIKGLTNIYDYDIDNLLLFIPIPCSNYVYK